MSMSTETSVKERSKAANFSNPSDYVRSLIREDQRRLAAQALFDEMLAKHLASNPAPTPAQLEKLRGKFWTQWNEAMIDVGIAFLERDGGRELNTDLIEGIIRRGREWLTSTKAV